MAEEKQKTETYNLLGGINTKASKYITSQNEFLNIVNMNFNRPGSLSSRHGSTQYVGATVGGRITGLIDFSKLNGASYLVATANTNAYTVTQSGFNVFQSGLANGALTDFKAFVDHLFYANGSQFYKFDGAQSEFFSLPPGTTMTATANSLAISGLTGVFTFAYGYLNDRGYAGPAINVTSISLSGAGATFTGLTTPSSQYGVTSIILYASDPNQSILFEFGSLPPGTTSWYLTGAISFSGVATLDVGAQLAPTSLWFTLAPKYLEIFNNSLFMSGISSVPSQMFFSDVGEPESVQPKNFIEVRTNDGDRITGLREFNGRMVISKRKSMHLLTGDSPQNYYLRELTTQYGCLSHRAMAVFEDQMLFLDEKGIGLYNGANVSIISSRVEPVFLSMNISAALDNAIAIHNRLENQVIFAIPTNGATMNNTLVVFDYLVNAFTIYDNLNISALTIGKQAFTTDTMFFGGYSGTIYNFGSSLYSDSGVGFTCHIKSRFHAPMGHSVEQQFRRLYNDFDKVGYTLPVNVALYPDFGSQAGFTTTIYLNRYQNRIDFGISSKAMSAEWIVSSMSGPIFFNGYTVESRLQRRT